MRRPARFVRRDGRYRRQTASGQKRTSALAQARPAAGDKDVRTSGSADVVRQALKAGVVEEVILHIAPVILGSGLRLFDGIGPTDLDLVQASVKDAAGVIHVTYVPKR